MKSEQKCPTFKPDGVSWGILALQVIDSALVKSKWCPGEDSNLHGFHHWYLKPARLPIPPPGQRGLGLARHISVRDSPCQRARSVKSARAGQAWAAGGPPPCTGRERSCIRRGHRPARRLGLDAPERERPCTTSICWSPCSAARDSWAGTWSGRWRKAVIASAS